jgi:hypothetical protein
MISCLSIAHVGGLEVGSGVRVVALTLIHGALHYTEISQWHPGIDGSGLRLGRSRCCSLELLLFSTLRLLMLLARLPLHPFIRNRQASPNSSTHYTQSSATVVGRLPFESRCSMYFGCRYSNVANLLLLRPPDASHHLYRSEYPFDFRVSPLDEPFSRTSYIVLPLVCGSSRQYSSPWILSSFRNG